MPLANNVDPDALALAAIVFVAGVFVGIQAQRLLYRLRRRTPRGTCRPPWPSSKPSATVATAPFQPPRYQTVARPLDAVDQLRIVMRADFTIQPLLNRSEARLFNELSRAAQACNPAWHVMAQVSLGEILRSTTAEAYWCINAKRVDLLLMDGDYQPRHVIEYQGGGHYQGTAAARDAVKREALRRAGIGYHEVVAGFTTPAELRRLVEKLVDRPGALPGG